VRKNPSTVALALITGVGPFCTDTYLAALPELRSSLHTSASAAQLTITMCIVGLAIGMFMGGTLSDGIGRRKPLFLTAAVFLVSSVVATVAPNIGVLLVARLFQGLASGAGSSIGRAVVSDRYSGLDAAKRFGTLGTIGLIAPVIAPAIGGGIIAFSGWRGVFVLMAFLGLVQLVAVTFFIPETLVRPDHHAEAGLVARLRGLVVIGRFQLAVATMAIATAGFFVYIGGSSFVLREHYGLSDGFYSLIFAVNALGMTLASLAFRLLIPHMPAERLRNIGVTMSTAAAIVMLVVSLSAHGNPPLAVVWGGLFVVVSGMGFTQSAATVIAQAAGHAAPGAASSLQAGTAFLIGAAATPLWGWINDSSVSVMVGLMVVFFVVIAGVLAVATARSRRPALVGAGSATRRAQ
jgi:MFS transporter, DHA1 family, multidrug resistance protein